MKNLSSITDNEDIVTKQYVLDKINFFNVEKAYYVKNKGNEQLPFEGDDITSALTLLDDRTYITGTGDLATTTSASTYATYKLDVRQYIPTSVTTGNRSTAFCTYAFYNSTDTFDSSTFLSGGHNSQISNTNQGQVNIETLPISEIPNGALTMLVMKYSNLSLTVNGYQGSSISPVIYGIETVSNAIDKWNTDGKPNAIIYKEYTRPTQTYRVGSTRTYTTLISAIEQWKEDEKPTATIYVDSGTYISISDPNAEYLSGVHIVGAANRLTIIGEDRDSTVVMSTTGKYIHPAINIWGGNITIKNMTFIANHSDNANFVYLDPDRQAQGKSPNSAYAVHCDGGSESGVIGGVIEFENCNMWSWQSQGLGCGTVPNGQLIVKDCDIRSYVDAPTTYSGSSDTEEYAKYTHGSRGGIIYHTSTSTSKSHEGFTMINSRVFIEGGGAVMHIRNESPAQKSGVKMITLINNTFWNNQTNYNRVIMYDTAVSYDSLSGATFNKLSNGNNIEILNNLGTQYSLKIE